MTSPPPTAYFEKYNPTRSPIPPPHYLGSSEEMVEVFTTSMAKAHLPVATQAPKAPDQQQNLGSQFKRSIPLIIFMTATVGGILIIIIFTILALRWRKKRKEKKHVEHHEQWLARQNLDREEERARRSAFGGYFDRAHGIHGRDFATQGRRGAGLALKPMGSR